MGEDGTGEGSRREREGKENGGRSVWCGLKCTSEGKECFLCVVCLCMCMQSVGTYGGLYGNVFGC